VVNLRPSVSKRARHLPVTGSQRHKKAQIISPAAGGGGRYFNPVGVVFLSLGQGEFNEPPPQVQGPTSPDGAWEQTVFRRAGPVSRHRQNPCTPAHGSPKAKPGILFSPTGRILVFRQHQRPGRSRTRLANSKSNRSLASPRRQARGVCLPRCTLKATAKTCLPPVSTSHPPTRVGGSPRFAKLPPPHSWGGGARKGGGEVSEPGCHENQSSCPDYFRHHQSPGRSPTRLAKKPAWV